MASFEKYAASRVLTELRHNTRESPRPPRNQEIDPERTSQNYSLLSGRRGGVYPSEGKAALASKSYYNERIKELQVLGRDDVKTAISWVITAPKDCPSAMHEKFFAATFDFLNQMYGEENCIQAIVHRDEGIKNAEGKLIAGEPHLHYLFIPVAPNRKYKTKEVKIQSGVEAAADRWQMNDDVKREYESIATRYVDGVEASDTNQISSAIFDAATLEGGTNWEAKVYLEKCVRRESERKEQKVCADELTKLKHLKSFHPALQKWLDDHGIPGTVSSGVTGGKNRTVAELKKATYEKEIEKKNDRIRVLEQKLEERTKNAEPSGWNQRHWGEMSWGAQNRQGHVVEIDEERS